MAKFYGTIGYAITKETKPGVYVPETTTREYFGELTRTALNVEGSNDLNHNINIANEISIVADPFAYENFHSMRYIEFMGAKWAVTKVEVKQPRLILTVGGVYNGS